MSKKKAIDKLIDFAKRPNKEIKRMKRKKEFEKKMAEMRKQDKLKAKEREKRSEFYSAAAVDKRRKQTDKDVKEYAAEMERKFMESSYGKPRKMKNGGIAMKGFGKAFVKGRK
jgi:hypothetical protein